MDKRIFAAVKIHPGAEFLRIYNSVKRELSGERITWVNPDIMHLTIRFFGEIPEEEIPEIVNSLTDAARRSAPVSLDIKGVGFFGRIREPKVIWFGIEHAETLMALERQVRKNLMAIGYHPEKEVFKPHLTIGRVKQPVNPEIFSKVMEQYKNSMIQQVTLSELILYESILKPRGPQYVALKKMVLGAV